MFCVEHCIQNEQQKLLQIEFGILTYFVLGISSPELHRKNFLYILHESLLKKYIDNTAYNSNTH